VGHAHSDEAELLAAALLLPQSHLQIDAVAVRYPLQVEMAPKGKAADTGAAAKGKGKGAKGDAEEKGGKVKASQYISVRHILVGALEERFPNTKS
jgi:hypothetical protein